MDAFGHINNARYLTYFEEARIKFLDDVIDWKYGRSTVGIILARAEVDFRYPAHFKDKVLIYTHCDHIGTKSFVLEYRMIKREGNGDTVLAEARTVIVMYDYEKKSSIEIPDSWKAAFKKYGSSG